MAPTPQELDDWQTWAHSGSWGFSALWETNRWLNRILDVRDVPARPMVDTPDVIAAQNRLDFGTNVAIFGWMSYRIAVPTPVPQPLGPRGVNRTPAPVESSLVFDRYGTLRDSPLPGQAHHLNQNAAYGGVIPQNEGISTKLVGDAIRQPGTPHYEAHDIMEGFLGRVQAGIADATTRDGVRPMAEKFPVQPRSLQFLARRWLDAGPSPTGGARGESPAT